MNDRELMRESLSALRSCSGAPHWPALQPIVTALRERLAQLDFEMQPCAGRNCGSTNPNLHSAECFEDYEKSTGMATQPVAWGVFDVNLHDMFFTEKEAHEMARLKGDGSTVAPLYAASPQRQLLTEWHPIDTAPKSGKKVILFYLNRNKFPRTVMARWLTNEQAAENDADGVGLEGGWYECIDNWDDYTEVAIHEGDPSHWMPLPEPPIESVASIKGEA